MLIQSAALIVCLLAWPSARQPAWFPWRRRGPSDPLHLPVNTPSKLEVTYEHDGATSAGKRAQTGSVECRWWGSPWQPGRKTAGCHCLCCSILVWYLSVSHLFSSSAGWCWRCWLLHPTPSPICFLDLHQEAESHGSSSRKTFLKSDTSVEPDIFTQH